MADSGPQFFKDALDLRHKASQERNNADRNQLLAEAQLNATLALVAAVVTSGNLTDQQLQHWRSHGLDIWD